MILQMGRWTNEQAMQRDEDDIAKWADGQMNKQCKETRMILQNGQMDK